MLSLTLFSLATLALTSLSAAAPAVVEATDGEFTSIDFDGRTLHYYTDAFEFDADPPAASLSKRDATCGASDFESAPPRKYHLTLNLAISRASCKDMVF